jgi:hypothetical protein
MMLKPFARRSSARLEPIKPAAPVIKTFLLIEAQGYQK